MKEVWKKVYDDYYEVSNLGRVRRAKIGGRNTRIGRVKKLTVGKKSGYVYVGLYAEGEHKLFQVHQLVALAFLGPCPEGKEVNHKDTNKQNNGCTNLEYVTKKENSEHAKRFGLLRPSFGSRNGASRLTEGKVKEIKNLYSTGKYMQKDLAKKFGVSTWPIWAIVNGKTWRHV